MYELKVATVLTACGIETYFLGSFRLRYGLYVATVLTACGIETLNRIQLFALQEQVATVLTACGIETLYYR